jgi:hypothetical protein
MSEAPLPPGRGFLTKVCDLTNRFSAVLPVFGMYFSTVKEASWHCTQAPLGTFFSLPLPACGLVS